MTTLLTAPASTIRALYPDADPLDPNDPQDEATPESETQATSEWSPVTCAHEEHQVREWGFDSPTDEPEPISLSLAPTSEITYPEPPTCIKRY